MTSTDKAVEICELRIEDCVTASKNASYITTIRDSYFQFQKDQDTQTLYNSVTLFLREQYKYNTNFTAAMLVFLDDPENIYFTYNNSTYGTYDNIKAFSQNALEQVLVLSGEIDTATVILNVNGRIYLVRNLVDSKFTPYGVIVLELNQASVFASLENVWGYVDGEIYLNGELLIDQMGQGETTDEQILQSVLHTKGRESHFIQHGKEVYAAKKIQIASNELTYLIRLDHTELFSEMIAVRYMFAMLFVFMIPLVILLIIFFQKKVTNPLHELVKASQKIEAGEYGSKIEKMASSAEFFYTDEVFNNMSKQLKNQFEKIYLEEIALRDAKIMALQSQINPHFLNNTLEIINWEARLNENYKVSAMIEALSTMLEATMNRKSESLGTLREELAYVDAYVYIIAQRFGEKFHFYKEIDEKLLDLRVPRLIVQPIVENAVEHGMDISRQGSISLRVHEQGEQIAIEVEDNGELTDEEREKIDRLLHQDPDMTKERRVSLGIRNVDQRLKIIYGSDSGLWIASNEENHTVSTILFKKEVD